MAPPDYLRQLAAFAANTPLAAIPEPVRARARLVLADCIPVIGAGMRVAQMQRLVATYLPQAGPGDAWVIGTGKRARPADAAWLNGMAGTWLELNEGNLHARGHPGIQVVPAAIAAAQQFDASGRDLLAAIIVGYETCARIARAGFVRLTIHPHGTWGVIGAAVAVARLMQFDVARMIETINMAATLGLATSRQTLLEGATVRNPFTGHSGRIGCEIAQLVDAGFTGQADAPSALMAGVISDAFDPTKVVDGLGSEWLLPRGYLKLNPTGRYVHAAFDALDDAIEHHGTAFMADDVARIDVRAYKLAAMLAGQEIASSFGSRFSIPFALATRIVHGHAWLEAFDDAAVANPRVQALARRVFVEEDVAHSAAYPAAQRCDVQVHLRDGRVVAGHCEIMKGESERPHAPDALRDKFFRLAEPLWGKANSTTLDDACCRIEAIDRFGAFARELEL